MDNGNVTSGLGRDSVGAFGAGGPRVATPDLAAAPAASPGAAAWPGLGRIAAFLGIIAALAFALNAVIDAGLRRITTSSFGVTNELVDGRINADILITGSSRAMVHYDPRILERATGRRAFNLGLNGSQIDMQVAMLETYLNHNARPRLIIHNLDLFSFVTSHEIYDPAQYLPYLGEEPLYRAIRHVYPDAWKWKYIPLYGYLVEDSRFTWVAGLEGLLGLMPPDDEIQGFVPRHLVWTADFEKLRAAHSEGVSFGIEPAGVAEVETLIRICHDRGIPLLFVYSPEYIEMQALEKDRAEIFARFREIAARSRVPLWDFSDSPLCRDRDNFYNSQHLNAAGAEAFSAELARRLASSGLLPPAPADRQSAVAP